MRVVREYRDAYPGKRMTQIYDELIQKGLFQRPYPSQSTVCRYLRMLGPAPLTPQVERRRFVMEHANDLWQADSCVGPYITIAGKKKKTYLIAFLDDASRIIPHALFFFEESARNMVCVLKEAILRRGYQRRSSPTTAGSSSRFGSDSGAQLSESSYRTQGRILRHREAR